MLKYADYVKKQQIFLYETETEYTTDDRTEFFPSKMLVWYLILVATST
jgi:hypothetical protein